MKQRCEEVEGDALTFRWNDHTYAWRVGGRNRITCAPMNDSPPSHQQKRDNILTGCAYLRLHLDHKQDFLCLRSRQKIAL